MRRRRAIAILVDTLVSEYGVQFLRSVERSARARDVDLLVMVGNGLASPIESERVQNRVFELVTSVRVDGAIAVSGTLGHRCGREGVLALCRSLAPLPLCSVGLALDGVPSFVIDNRAAMALGVGHLIDVHGCRRIAFLAGPKGSIESNDRLAGYRSAHADRGLPVDERLIEHGNFTMSSGVVAMQALLTRPGRPDAIAVANDSMALGGLDTLQQAGISVPRDLRICGFDDINAARFARPQLSTLRQPMWWLAEQALDAVLRQISGEPVAMSSAGSVEFVRRESCGCGYQVGASVSPSGAGYSSTVAVLRERHHELVRALTASVSIPTSQMGHWPEAVLDALEQELSGDEGRLSAVFEELLERAQVEGASLDEFQRVVSALRLELWKAGILDEAEKRRLERIWHAARVMVAAASVRILGREGLDVRNVASALGRSGERFSSTLNLALLRQTLISDLPWLKIRRGAVSLYSGPDTRRLKLLAAIVDGREVAVVPDEFPEAEIGPDVVLSTESSSTSIVLPLTFDSDLLGIAVFESGSVLGLYEALRQQIGAAVKVTTLHREMVAQIEARQRLERERVIAEARLAAEIQTSICPPTTEVRGLEIAAVTLPATEAGGDYHDVLPARDGAWIAIGDVTGHGLGAGLVMLMIQSMVASLSRIAPEPTPTQIVNAVNEALWDNVRRRIHRDDHASLTVLRYFVDGRLRFAGAHEDVLVWRARTAMCEFVPTPGVWVGALSNIAHLTTDSDLDLEPGDVMVLYTDGVTEPRNEHHEQFGRERLAELLAAAAREPAAVIRDRIVAAVRAWSAVLDDDLTLLVARYVGG